MPSEHLVLLTFAIGVVAFLYSSVGHAGASGYIAVMSLAAFAPATIRPVALVLNIVVACLATWHFWRAGHFSWRLFWPFAALSIPFAFLGGYLKLPNPISICSSGPRCCSPPSASLPSRIPMPTSSRPSFRSPSPWAPFLA